MRQPETPEEYSELHNILRSDPKRYLDITNQWIHADPNNSSAYFSRHQAWMTLGQPDRALDDIDRVIELDPQPVSFMSRGDIYRHLGQYERALEDYNRGEAMDPTDWDKGIEFGLLYQADCHARLGDEPSALAYCARLPDNFWTPGVQGTPAGGKADIAEALGRIAAQARAKRV